jgi:hypothetical protein
MRKLFRKRSSRGTALVETAIVVPLFCLLLFGSAECGYLFEDTFAVQNMVRGAARTAGAMGTQQAVDHYVLESINDAASGIRGSQIKWISVYSYDSTTATGIPTGCGADFAGPVNTTASPQGVPGKCNVYGPSDIPGYAGPGLAVTDFGAPNCTSKADADFCPTVRANTFPNPGVIGIYIRLDHNSITHLIFNNQRIERHVTFQLDPDISLL